MLYCRPLCDEAEDMVDENDLDDGDALDSSDDIDEIDEYDYDTLACTFTPRNYSQC